MPAIANWCHFVHNNAMLICKSLCKPEAWMFRKQITKPVRPGQARRVHRGVDQVQVKHDGKLIWANLTATGRVKLVLPEWYSTLRLANGQIKIVKLARDKTASELLLAKLRTEQSLIQSGALPANITSSEKFADLIERFRGDCARKGCTDVYLRKSKFFLGNFMRHFSIKSAAQIVHLSSKDLGKWLDGMRSTRFPGQKISDLYKREAVSYVKTFLVWLKEEKHIHTVPPFPKLSGDALRQRRALTRAEVDRLEATAPWPRNLFYALSFATMARFSALCSIDASDIHLDDPAGPWLKLQKSKSKTRTEQRVPIPHRLVPKLHQRIEEVGPAGKPFEFIKYISSNRRFKADLDAARIPHETVDGVAVLHSLRHGGATELLMNGVDVLMVQRMGGWRSINMLAKFYAHLSPVKDREKIDKVFE